MALNQRILSQFQGVDPNGMGIPMGDAMATREAGIRRVRDNRERIAADRFSQGLGPEMNFSAPDPMWDGYFGAFQNRENLVNRMGGEMKTDFRSRNAGAGLQRAVANAGKMYGSR